MARRSNSTSSPSASEGSHVAVVWFRNDLRLSDNEPLASACASNPAILLPIYCIDSTVQLQPRRMVEQGGLGVPKLGPHRCRLLLQALHSLRDSLQARGSDLLVEIGRTEAIIARLVSLFAPRANCGLGDGSSAGGMRGLSEVQLFYNQGVGPQSADLEAAVVQALRSAAAASGLHAAVHPSWGHTLYHPDDLPYDAWQGVSGVPPVPREQWRPESVGGDSSRFRCCPDVMTQFRKPLQAGCLVRREQPEPAAPLPPFMPVGGTGGVLQLQPLPQCAWEVYERGGVTEAARELERLLGGSDGGGGGGGEASRAGASPIAAAMRRGVRDPPDPRSAFPFAAGEREALSRLRYYLGAGGGGSAPKEEAGQQVAASAAADGDQQPEQEQQQQQMFESARLGVRPIDVYQDSRMQAAGVDTSTKLSAFLSLGCLSPRTVYAHVRAAQQQQQQQCGSSGGGSSSGGKLENFEWLVMHLGIRDFFLYTAIKEGSAMFSEQGIRGQPLPWQTDPKLLRAWARGMTGLPFVDACMRELAGSGWMSNRGRQNCASLLAKELNLEWRLGMELFECLLLDCDEAVNATNWNYFAGVGNDPRNRRFKTVTQGEQYDEDASLAREWLPELSRLPTRYRHRPWDAQTEVAAQAGLVHGVSYPAPLVDPAGQIGSGPKGGGGGPSAGSGTNGDAAVSVAKARRRGKRQQGGS